MSNPWVALPDDVLLVHAPIGDRGRYYHQLRAIVLRTGLRLDEQRGVLWHELVHAERGDLVSTPKLERAVNAEAARRAIDLVALADALLWSEHAAEVADQLKITVEVLRVRLEHLHPAERGYLTRALSMREATA